FKSSDPKQLELLRDGEGGVSLVWHPGNGPLKTQTVTGTLAGMNAADGSPTTLTNEISVPVPSPAPTRTVTAIAVSPGNTVLLDPAAEAAFSGVAFYDERTIDDVSDSVTWSLE